MRDAGVSGQVPAGGEITDGEPAGDREAARAIAIAEALGAACAAADGAPPFNDQALVELRRGERRAVGDDTALAVVGKADGRPEVELAVHPEHRGRGLGGALAARLADELGGLDAWAHGDHPGSRAIAARLGMARVRTLLQLRAPVPAGLDRLPDGARAFEPADASALLELNAAAFADHPEQGRMSADDLAARRAEPWHDDANLVVLPGEAGLDGFAWVKADAAQPDVAELYVLGVSPERQGAGIGRRMLEAAFARMRALGATTAHLYVEGDNEPALALYRRAGFAQWAIDVRWRLGD
ncbi:mycothiol synthase [Agrococcus carbonis]|uniref:Mycothiol acetyltransferase n=1 Tax=Agrococcus carbonis TaxID=684552 RepID=A0A1H1R618_9MICO|nr:mycothiol synthase [Agrococcus carbonis]SDS31168.1 mycothiol synthase [Agrococcus carbonis]